MRLAVKKILKKYGYPPDKQEKAAQTILKQAEEIASDWMEPPNRISPSSRDY
jgi:type I restriction enzyme R subunit